MKIWIAWTLILASLCLSACGAGQVLTPAVTPLPILTPALSATPVPPTPTLQATSTTEKFPTITTAPTPKPTDTLAATIPFENGPREVFSRLFPPAWSKEWTGHIGGMDVSFTFGLSNTAIHGSDVDTIPKISSIWMNKEGTGVDSVVDAFLRAAHNRYTNIMGNTITYEDYLTLLKTQPRGGEVSLMILDKDGKTWREAMIDPRKGISVLLTGDPKMPVETTGGQGFFYGVGGDGQLQFATNELRRLQFYQEEFLDGVPIKNYVFLKNVFVDMTIFGFAKDSCMASGGNYVVKCGGGNFMFPSEIQSWTQMMTANMKEQLEAIKTDPTKKLEPLWGW